VAPSTSSAASSSCSSSAGMVSYGCTGRPAPGLGLGAAVAVGIGGCAGAPPGGASLSDCSTPTRSSSRSSSSHADDEEDPPTEIIGGSTIGDCSQGQGSYELIHLQQLGTLKPMTRTYYMTQTIFPF